ncbi:MAG TPA: acyl-CoA dehydrogenase family protein [Acidimicrobiales bacterium]|nr:acyl-CoA dehydrogenase family protein [Acidimicrobiales bacterium]
MTDTADRIPTSDDPVAEVKAWLAESWDPDLTVAEWWERLGTSGWGVPTWPRAWFGRDLSRAEGVRVQQAIVDFGALPAPGGLGLMLAGPTIVVHGTDEQRSRYLPDIVTGRRAWCQLFSEPGAGSDLAGLNARAVKDGDEWVVNGQKVWTSGGQVADLGMLIARTDPDQPKHAGITYFAIDMHQPGVDVRPLREMTGRALFNEVFLEDARVPDSAVIGGLNNGWRVANTTLMFERASLGAGGGSAAASLASPGTVAGDLPRRAGDFVRGGGRRGGDAASLFGASAKALARVARQNGRIGDPSVRQRLMELYTIGELARFNNLRLKAAMAAGGDIPGLPNIAKLLMSSSVRLSRDVGLEIMGGYGTLHAYDPESRKALDEATGMPGLAGITEMALFAQAPSIYGGTDQVQRNIIGERVLGLPKEPGPAKGTPFRELPKNG